MALSERVSTSKGALSSWQSKDEMYSGTCRTSTFGEDFVDLVSEMLMNGSSVTRETQVGAIIKEARG